MTSVVGSYYVWYTCSHITSLLLTLYTSFTRHLYKLYSDVRVRVLGDDEELFSFEKDTPRVWTQLNVRR